MRLGAQTCKLVPGTQSRRAYGAEEINELHEIFSQAVVDLFEAHKASHGWQHKSLDIV